MQIELYLPYTWMLINFNVYCFHIFKHTKKNCNSRIDQHIYIYIYISLIYIYQYDLSMNFYYHEIKTHTKYMYIYTNSLYTNLYFGAWILFQLYFQISFINFINYSQNSVQTRDIFQKFTVRRYQARSHI